MNRLLTGNNIIVLVADLFSFIVENFATEKLILEWARNNSIKIQVAIHVSRD